MQPDEPAAALTVRNILELVNLGSSVAEHDEPLRQHLIETSTLKKVVQDKVDVVAGDKSTGKTAHFVF
jgi:hypothetical protein